MVRETRHLWVGNLPDNIREERIRDHFKRYGRVQNVKLLAGGGGEAAGGGGGDNDVGGGGGGAGGGVCAAVAFMDIKSAAKAHGVDHTLDERLLTTVYYEPQAILSRPSSPPAAAATPAYQGSSSGASSGTAPGTQSTVDRTARPRDRPYRNGPPAYPASAVDGCSRGGSHQRWYGGYGSSPTPSAETVGPEVGAGGRRRARSGSSSGSGSSSRSVSSSSAARSGSSSSSRASSSRGKRRRPSGGRPLAICVRNLPQRSSDSSLKDGLFHEYKKHGKVSCVKVVGANQDRYAVVRFKKASDAEKALEVSQDKLFFGCKISVAPYQGTDADDDESRPYETDLDEFHPKATRTLFVGNLDKDATAATLRDKFKHFGKIVEIDVKKQSGGAAGYAFCQYANISSVVEAIRNMDGEHVGGSRVKLGFGKSMATSCIWIDGVTESSEKQVFAQCTRIGAVTQISLCNGSGHALVAFEQVAAAQQAVKELRGLTVRGRKLQVDFASRECQEAFYEQREKQCNSVGATPETRAPAEVRFSELPVRNFESAPVKYNRYDGSPRSRQASVYGRNRNSRFLSQSSGEHFDATAEFADRRFRYEDFSGGSGSEAAYDSVSGVGAVISNGPALQSVVVVSSPASGPPAPPPPLAPNMRLLQKERVHLLEQLEECPSSGDELISPKKRFKAERASLGRRSSAETGNRHHRDVSPCIKRRRGSEASRHRWHTPSPASRPGTPLHDERPDSPPPTEPRRLIPLPRRSVPMCLPLPRFAAQILPRVAHVSPQHPPSGPPPPASPQRAPSPASSGGSSPSPAEPSLDERIRSLDERYEKWSGSRAALGDAQERTRVRHHLLDLDVAEVQPSEVMRSVLAKRSVFDEDLKRLESIGDKYEAPTKVNAVSAISTVSSICAFPSPSANRISPSPLNSPQSAGRSPFAGSPSVCATIKAVVVPPAPALPPSNAAPPAKGLQYPFPSHPPLATTPVLDGATSSLSSSSGSSECSDESVKGLFSERVSVNHIDSVNIPRNGGNISSCVDRVPVSLSYSCEVVSAQASVALSTIGRSKTVVVATSRSVPLKCESKTFKVSERKSPAYADPSAPGDDDLDTIEEGDVKTKCGVVNSDNLDRRKNERISVESVKSDSELNVKENRDQSLKQKVSEKPHSDKRTSDKVSVNTFSDCDSRMRESSKVEPKKFTISEKVLELSEKRKLHKEEKLSRIFNEKDNKKTDDRKKRDEDKCESFDDLSERISNENLENDTVALERTERVIDSGKERLDCERRDQEQLEREKNEKDRIEKERKEKEKIERDRLDKDRREKDKLEQVEKERIERELVEKERREKEKLEREKREKEKAEKERREKEKIEKDRAQRERLEREKSDRRELERIDRERCDRERHERVDRPVDPKTDKYEKRKEKEKDPKKKEEREILEDPVAREKRKEKEEHSNDGRHRHKDVHKKENHIDKCEKKDFNNKIHENNKHKDNGRKISREDSIREIVRKDSSDSAASRNSHDSNKSKDQDNNSEVKDDFRYSSKSNKIDNHRIRHHDKEFSPKSAIKLEQDTRHEKKDKCFDVDSKSHSVDVPTKDKRLSVDDKQRHYSFDSQNEHRNHELKRKERLNSSCSLPAGVGIKRRVSSQDSFEHEECKKPKLNIEKKAPERRDSRDSGGKQSEKNKHSKSLKNNLTKHTDDKVKEDLKKIKLDFEHNADRIKNKDYKEKDRESNEITNNKENSEKYNDVDNKIDYDTKDFKENCRNKFNDKFKIKRTNKESDIDVKLEFSENSRERDLASDKEFLERLELRSSLEDEKQSALKREYREKKRLQQLQQIQQLQLQQNVTQQQHQPDDKKIKISEERKKEIKEKRISTERKSREDLPGIKSENMRKKCRKMTNSTDTSDSDEPKKHSIFDIVDEGPTYISMYDKVKARSCKNMQKQEEEKRQEKIKAKFSQLKQSRAKREEKKRSNSWDEDSDSDREHKKSSSKSLIASSSEDEFRRRHKENITTDSENDIEKYKMQKTINDLCDGDSTDDAKNKNISRKNSRSRIMSDTSDDEAVKRGLVKIELFSSSDLLDGEPKKRIKLLPKEEPLDEKDERINNIFDKSSIKNHYYENSIALKTLIDDKKPIVDPESPFIKNEHYIKSENMYRYNSQYSDFEYDTYSEEVVISDSAKSKNSFEVRKKHKKKQKRQKVYPSDDEINGEFDKSLNENVDIKNNAIKRKHINKKDKKRDRIKFDDINVMKDTKKLKRILEPTVEGRSDTVNNMKSFEIMQDIFGSLSDECDEKVHSDKSIFDSNYGKCKEEVKLGPPLLDLFNIKEKNNHFYNSKVEADDYDLYSKNSINADMTLKEKYKEDLKKKKEKKKKEKKLAIKDDENSLDIDAAGKAIEASLCADTQTEAKKVLDKSDLSSSLNTSIEPDIFRFTDGDDSRESSLVLASHKMINSLNKDIKEKKKKKKRSKEEKLNRKEYHHHHHRDKSVENNENKHTELFKPDYIIPCDDDEDDDKVEVQPVVECKPPLPSPSLPRLTDSPPLAHKQPESPEGSPSVEIISSPTPTVINKPEVRRLSDKFIPGFGVEIDDKISENAVKSISDFDTPIIEVVEPKPSSLICNEVPKTTEKNEEKQRAIISQEETEDAVAALLGESFGSRDIVFDDCYNETPQSHESSIETVQPEVNNVTTIPDEEAEEMRQAVQSLNVVTELEMKPETPLSENDLQIDTDTDDGGDDVKVETRKVEETSEPQAEAEIQKIVPREPSINIEESKPPIETIPTVVEERVEPAVLPKEIVDIPPKTDKVVPDEPLEIVPPKINDALEINTAPPTVISKGWSLSAHKPNEQPLLISAKPLNVRDEKPLHITTSILHLKPINVSGQCRPLLATASKVPGTYQVINQAPRPTTIFNAQPPTIKIPEQHVIYQRQPNIVVSPRTASADIRLNSPKSHVEMQSKVTNMILTTGPPNLHSPSGLPSSAVVQQRSPSQITVVRMQQPPLSPIQTSHLPNNQQNRSMLSPTQHNTVVIQNQNSTVQLNRLPLTPLLAPISKPLIANNLNIPQTKVVVPTGNSTIIQTPKLISSVEVRKPEIKVNQEAVITNPKMLLSTTAVSNVQNSTIIMQNRITNIPSSQNIHPSPILMSSHIITKTVIAEKPTEAIPLSNGPDNKPTVINNNHNFNQLQQIHINTAGPVIQSTPKQTVVDVPNPAKQLSPVQNNVSQTQHFVTPALVSNIVQVDTYKKDTVVTGYPAAISKTPTINSTIISIAKPTVLNIIEKPPIALQLVPAVAPPSVNTIENDNCSIVETITSKIEKDDSGDSAFESSDTSGSDKPKCETDFEELLKQTAIVTKIERPINDVVPAPTDTAKVELVIPNEDIKPIPKVDTKTEPENVDSKDAVDIKEDIDNWSAKDINIDSVIKKVDALCDVKENDDEIVNSSKISWTPDTPVSNEDRHEKNDSPIEMNDTNSCDNSDEVLNKVSLKARRGGGRTRGRKIQDRITERVQTRQGNKPKAPVTTMAKRGRGKGRMDKKCKSPPPTGTNEPGDVYDFHEDSGDEMDNSPQKGEQRPRLILTIKSPLVNNVIHPLAATPAKEVAPIKPTLPASPSQPIAKDEKVDDFVSPPTNTRKSRRLQEKDGTRNTVDDIIEDVVKNALQNRGTVTGKDTTPVRRSTRQNVAKLAVTEKTSVDVRKSPRAMRKIKDRRPSETSIDSSDEKVFKKDNVEIEIDKKLLETKESTVKADTKESIDSVNMEPTVNLIIKPIVKINPEVIDKLMVKPDINISEDKSKTVIDAPVQNTKSVPPVEAAVINLNKPVIVSTVNAAITPNLTKKIDNNLKNSEELMLDPATGELVYMRSNDEGNFVPVSAGKRTESIVTSYGNPVLIARNAAETKIVSQSQPVSSTGQPVSCITTTITQNTTSPPETVLVSSVVKSLTPNIQMNTSRIQANVPQNSEVKIISTNPSVVQPPTTLLPTNAHTTSIIVSSAHNITPGSIITKAPVSNVQLSVLTKGQIGSVPTIVSKVLPANTTGKTIITQQSVQSSNKGPIQLPLGSTPLSKIAGPLSPHVQQNVTVKLIGQQLKPHPMQPQIAHPPQKSVPVLQIGQAPGPGALGPGPLGPSLPRGAQHSSPPLLMAKHLEFVGPQPVITGASSSRLSLTAVPSISPQAQVPMHGDMLGTRSPPPAHQQTSPITPGDGVYPQFAHQHYQLYYRSHQEVRATPSPYVARSPHGAEGSEAPSPPLELRRPPCARVPHPAHSPSLSDRSTDSPQVTQVYPMSRPSSRVYIDGTSAEPPNGGRYYDSPAPPPAHVPRVHHAPTNHQRILSEAPAMPKMSITQGPGMGVNVGGSVGEERGPSRGCAPTQAGAGQSQTQLGPPHASHAPREADSLMMLLRRYPVMWQGLLALKNDAAAVQMHFVHGNPAVAGQTLPCNSDGSTAPLRIAQRMRLEPVQLEAVARKMQMENEHCMLLALPCGRDHSDVLQQSTHLTSGFITYLRCKQAAGIVNVAPPGHHQALYTVHIFPSCDFANENLERIAPDLLHRVADIAHLLIVIATV